MVFFGEYQVSFSAPGRLVLPKKIRELLKGNIFILTKGFNFCLAGFDKEAWEDKAKQFLSTSLLDEENLDKKRVVFSSAVYLEIDEQGRFVVPKSLLLYGHLSDSAAIIGVGDHFEIWKPQLWEKYQK